MSYTQVALNRTQELRIDTISKESVDVSAPSDQILLSRNRILRCRVFTVPPNPSFAPHLQQIILRIFFISLRGKYRIYISKKSVNTFTLGLAWHEPGAKISRYICNKK